MALSAVASLLMGCSSLPSTKKIPTTSAQQRIYLVHRDWHTSIVLPADAVRIHSRFLKEEAAGQQFIRVGWGDGIYFTGKDKSIGSATRALFVSRYSALQVLAYQHDPFSVPSETQVPLAISEAGLRRLIRYIDDSISFNDERPESLPAYGDGVGHFYRARGQYGLLSNCNTWSGRALQAAGLPVRSRLQLTARSVLEQAQAISMYQFAQGGASVP